MIEATAQRFDSARYEKRTDHGFAPYASLRENSKNERPAHILNFDFEILTFKT